MNAADAKKRGMRPRATSMSGQQQPGRWLTLGVVVALALPAILIQAWLVYGFSGFDRYHFMTGALFALCFCTLLVLGTRWRLLGRITWLPAAVLYVAWIVLVLCEAVSYSLQDDTFNDRFFAHLDPRNLETGLHGFPLLIGGGLAVLVIVALLAAWLLSRLPAKAMARAKARSIAIRLVMIASMIPSGASWPPASRIAELVIK